MVAKLRRFCRLTIAHVLYFSGALPLWRWWRASVHGRKEVCVLGLHRVLTEEQRRRTSSLDAIVLGQETFARMLDYLQRQFSVVSLDALQGGQLTPAHASKPLCLLTFDDGWRDNYSIAYPLLKEFKMPATIFVVSGLVSTRKVFWVERLRTAWVNPSTPDEICSRLNGLIERGREPASFEQAVECLKHLRSTERERILKGAVGFNDPLQPGGDVDMMMDWDQVAEMSRNGIEFGAHTVNHPLLTYEDNATVDQELRLCKEELEAKLAKKVRAFAYPNGDWDERVRQAVKRANYECAFTTRPGWHAAGEDPYAIRRILLHEGNVTGYGGEFSPAVFNFTVAGWN